MVVEWRHSKVGCVLYEKHWRAESIKDPQKLLDSRLVAKWDGVSPQAILNLLLALSLVASGDLLCSQLSNTFNRLKVLTSGGDHAATVGATELCDISLESP